MKKWLVLISVFFLMSCAHEQKEQNQSLQQENITNVSHNGSAKRSDQQHAEKAVQMLKERQDVKDAVAVEANGRLLVAYQVKHLHRFRMKQIEKDVRNMLNDAFDEKVIASHDLKIFWKTKALKEKIETKQMNEKEIEKEVTVIQKLSEEQT
ncbi:YhcN/YlaJ family sporulation lipoprotein [Anoxybacillus sp. LAT_35]|uniref:YhcN/YlaJ family sporulation lipoprotein n=1 Tax=unclassified Anoxybacillus TaxID=2639704 RepID=UPI001EDAD2DA|nr:MULTISPECIES: YhcN/YlaJ family sporulation lipoprotein [unclassified Anoxybacillus]MCG5025971.1 YhcN/YlaJ family sporulation lipoprotein [Anoxybacillus flavithermus]MCG3085579.1 YhcN/YlaJ family sporulation lipoprotein [Anoxybacillus sp. LAT27]MCG6170837.1 YhcN/YlaJ family sporulation lipoprotein [Anoxybacillus sp. LAT_11]MCG6175808.1 YhcN/YlaJ family sporulation lipoprotein [Anoxybacillus sp. LAT_31]MCG6177511.1 YhcN/YlaJ family sporulation lipoprotein [Anoxybacillus sp. LAT_35]